MSKVIEVIERDGRNVLVYESGLERDAESGRILKPAAGTLITRQNSTAYHRRRQEKTAALLRRRITDATNSGLLPPGVPAVRDSAEAFAVGGQVIWEDVVMNADAYPRDRLEAWQTLGKYSRVLPADPRQADADPDESARLNAAAAVMNVQTARILARVLADVKRAQASPPPAVVDGTATG